MKVGEYRTARFLTPNRRPSDLKSVGYRLINCYQSITCNYQKSRFTLQFTQNDKNDHVEHVRMIRSKMIVEPLQPLTLDGFISEMYANGLSNGHEYHFYPSKQEFYGLQDVKNRFNPFITMGL